MLTAKTACWLDGHTAAHDVVWAKQLDVELQIEGTLLMLDRPCLVPK